MIWISLGALLGIAGFLGVWYFGSGHESPSTGSAIFQSVISLSLTVLGVYLAMYVLRFKLILRTDSIEIQTLGSKRLLLRDDIEERRLLNPQNISTLELIPSDKQKKTLKIWMTMRTDVAFDAWFASIPDLDAVELAKSENQIANDLTFGLTPEQRLEQLGNAKKIAKWLTWIGYAISAWGVFYPHPYRLMVGILAAVPFIVVMLVMRSKGLYQLEARRNDARPNLLFPFFLPGAVLALRALAGVNFLRWIPLFAFCLVGSCVLTLLIASADPHVRQRRVSMLTIFFFAAFYALGVAAQADELLDHSDPQSFRVLVFRKWVARSSKSTTYYLRVGPWGPKQEVNDVSVPWPLYNVVLPQQTVCINLLQGALKIPWYYATSCR